MHVSWQGQDYICVPDDLKTSRILAMGGLTPPGPIMREYDWPCQYDSPFDHQAKTANFLTLNPRAFVFNEIGTGKTLPALWAADFLMKHGIVGRTLIVSTLSTLWSIWDDGLFKSLHDRTKCVVHGTKKKRLQLLAKPHDFYIINHDGLKTLCKFEELGRRGRVISGCSLNGRDDISHVIVDEGAELRNWSTDVYKAMWHIAGPDSGRTLWWMTGSPMPKAPTDIWAQARIVNPDLVPRRYTRFRDQTMKKVSQFKWVPRKGWEDNVFAMLKPSVRYKRDECLDLPPLIVEDITVPMSKEQEKAYKSMLEQYAVELAQGTITAANEGVKLIKLRQIACGAIYDAQRNVIEFDVKAKLQALEQIINEAGRKAIVFTPFKHSIRLLQRFLETKTFSVVVVNGDVAPKQRKNRFDSFQLGDTEVLLAHPECMSHGLDLTASAMNIWWSPIDDASIEEQANGRITRASQKRKQTIIRLSCSEAEKKVYARNEKKLSTQGLLLELLTSR